MTHKTISELIKPENLLLTKLSHADEVFANSMVARFEGNQGEFQNSCTKSIDAFVELKKGICHRLLELGNGAYEQGNLAEAFRLFVEAERLHPGCGARTQIHSLLTEAILKGENIPNEFFSSIALLLDAKLAGENEYNLLVELFSAMKLPGCAQYFRHLYIMALAAQGRDKLDRDINSVLRESLDLREQEVSSSSRRPHVILSTLPGAGTAAINPILMKLLPEYGGYELFGRGQGPMEVWFPYLVNSSKPLYIGGHPLYDPVMECLARPDVKCISLIRDPRDAAVSEMKVYQCNYREAGCATPPSESEELLSLIKHTMPWRAANADKWHTLPRERCLPLTFEKMKKDMPRTITEVLEFLELSVPHSRVLEVCEQYSFLKLSGRREGESEHGIQKRELGLFFRKGTPGDWKIYFNEEHIAAFKEGCEKYLERWGYQW